MNLRALIVMLVLAVVLASGWLTRDLWLGSRSQPSPPSVLELTSSATETRAPNTRLEPIVADLGTIILLSGQDIHHEFVVRNPLDDELLITNALARKPCCSQVGSVPESIPPKAAILVPVLFRPAEQSGRRRVQYQLVAESEDATLQYLLSLHVNLVPEFQVQSIENGSFSTIVGRTTVCRFAIDFHSLGHDEEAFAPDRVEAVPPLAAVFVGNDDIVSKEGGVVAVRKTIEVELPAVESTGFRSGTLVFHGPGERKRELEIRWNARASLDVQPTMLLFRGAERPNAPTIFLQSNTEPFRILAVANPFGETRVAQTEEPKKLHVLPIALDRPPGPNDSQSIVIETDHPDHPNVTIGVMDLSQNEPPGGGHDEGEVFDEAP